ncbi:MAG: hypothetical protein ACKO24_17695 [Leptolyngbyaceae cyanobacterium]
MSRLFKSFADVKKTFVEVLMAPPDTVLSSALFTQSLPILSLGDYIEVKEGLYQPINLSSNTNRVTGVDLVTVDNTAVTESNNFSSAS